MVLQLKKPRIQ